MSQESISQKTKCSIVMRIGYARASTENQKPDLQSDAHKGAECEVILEEKTPGKHPKRYELNKLVRKLHNDTLVVTETGPAGKKALKTWLAYWRNSEESHFCEPSGWY